MSSCFTRIKAFIFRKNKKSFFFKFASDQELHDVTISTNPRTFNSMFRKPKEVNDKIIDAKLLTNLNTISELQVGQKLYLENDVLTVDTNYYMQGLLRSYYGQNRENTVKYLTHIITLALELNIPPHEQLSVVLPKCKIGLQNLAKTYESCPDTVKKIDELILKIN